MAWSEQTAKDIQTAAVKRHKPHEPNETKFCSEGVDHAELLMVFEGQSKSKL